MTIDARGPGGAFLHPEETRPLVLVAGGIGITPLISMLRHTLENEPSRPVTLILSSRTLREIPFLDELRVLARRHPNFHFVPVLSGGSTSNEFFSVRVDARLLETVVPHPAESDCMICGPVAMIDDARDLLEQLGVPRPRIHFEKFEAAAASAAAAATDRMTSAANTTVTFRGSGRAVAVKPGESILDAAEAAGETIPCLCRVGACGTCRIRVVEGKVTGDFDAIDRTDQTEGYVLACVAQAVTSCVVEV
jgi:ferredoxin-NADP reductase